MPASSYSPQEVAADSGAPLAAVQKAITAKRIPARAVGPSKRRRLDETALLAFALSEALPAEFHLTPGAAYKLLRQAPKDRGSSDLVIGEVVRIDAGKALAAARQRLVLYNHARQIIVSDASILGGAPTIRGTRI